MVLPAGFAIPPLPHLLALLVAVGGVGWLLVRRRPPVTERAVLAFVPWVLVGSALHALHQIGGAPGAVRPLLGAPAVYATTFAVAGGVWLAADRAGAPAGALAGAGSVAFLGALAGVLASAGTVDPRWSLVGLTAGVALGGAAWLGLRWLRPRAARVTGAVGALVVVGHALDGVSTAIGVDVLGFGERTPASRAIMDLAGALPTADLLGVGWLFVAVKLLVAGAVVALFEDYVEEAPAEGYLLLGAVAAVGLGPGVHNLVLYAVR